MSINLSKGSKINLSKEVSNGKLLKEIILGLGWDVAEKGANIDIDAIAILIEKKQTKGGFFFKHKNTEEVTLKEIVSYSNLRSSDRSVEHNGDNLTGAGEGDDEQITVKLENVPSNIVKIGFGANIYQAHTHCQHFGMIKNVYIRVVDSDTNIELCRFDLTRSDYDGMTGVIAGEVVRTEDGEWEFHADGSAHKVRDYNELAKTYAK